MDRLARWMDPRTGGGAPDRSDITRMFRNPPQLGALIRLVADRPQLRVAIYGVADGAEAVSLLVAADPARTSIGLRIDGYDINGEYLRLADTYTYPRRHFLPDHGPARYADYFEPSGSGWRLRERWRACITYAYGDVLNPGSAAAGAAYHLVMCQNVLVSLSPADSARAIANLAALVRPGGLLAIGGGPIDLVPGLVLREGFTPILDDVEAIHEGWTVQRRFYENAKQPVLGARALPGRTPGGARPLLHHLPQDSRRVISVRRYPSIERVHVVLPGLTAPQWRCGGLLIAHKLAELLAAHVPTGIVTSADREPGVPYLDDVLPGAGREDVFVVTWGPHVQELLSRLDGRRIVYYAQSTGWGSRLPVSIPILCLSRFIMAWWMREAPYNALFLLGPVLDADCVNRGRARDIDVLFVERKSTAYLRDRLVPALREQAQVHIVRDFIPREDLFDLYNRSRVYLYSSAPWRSGWVEGFGFQPLEALVCGCTVFSNLHGGLSDYLDPGINAFKLEVHSLEYDVTRILRAIATAPPQSPEEVERLRGVYSEAAFHRRADAILSSLDELFLHVDRVGADVAPLKTPTRSPFAAALDRARHKWRREEAGERLRR